MASKGDLELSTAPGTNGKANVNGVDRQVDRNYEVEE